MCDYFGAIALFYLNNSTHFVVKKRLPLPECRLNCVRLATTLVPLAFQCNIHTNNSEIALIFPLAQPDLCEKKRVKPERCITMRKLLTLVCWYTSWLHKSKQLYCWICTSFYPIHTLKKKKKTQPPWVLHLIVINSSHKRTKAYNVWGTFFFVLFTEE